MKESILRRLVEEYNDIKKISAGDFSEIEQLEENPMIQRYKHLLKLKEARFELDNEDRISGHILSEYGQGLIQETNNIWCLAYEISAQKYEEWFNESLIDFDKNSIVLVYFDIENNQRHIVIRKEEQECFEQNHNVITGNLSILDNIDRYYNVRDEFFRSCIKDGQEVAIQKILTKYAKEKI